MSPKIKQWLDAPELPAPKFGDMDEGNDTKPMQLQPLASQRQSTAWGVYPANPTDPLSNNTVFQHNTPPQPQQPQRRYAPNDDQDQSGNRY